MVMLAGPKIQDEVIASMSGMAASQVNISQNKMKEYFFHYHLLQSKIVSLLGLI